MAPTLKAMGLTPLMAAVLVGAAQNVFSKSAKYSLFDPCKEMAYIPLDDEVRSSVLACWQWSILHSMGCLCMGLVACLAVLGLGAGASGHPMPNMRCQYMPGCCC